LYTSFYNLLEKPFELGTDLRYLYLSAHHREALAHLTYGVEERKSFVQLTGEVGTGKTTLLDALVDGLDVTTKVARLSYTTIGEEDLLRELARELGVEPLTGPKIEIRRRIADFLDERTRAGRNAVFVVDEAQNLGLGVLEEVRLLSNLRSMGINSIQIVLAGQPELREKLELKELRQLRQRIGIRYHLVPLSRSETGEYIAHRLAVAGAAETGIFDSGALDMVYEYSKGVPRVVNIACDRALLAGYAENKRRIGRRLMRETIDTMEGLVPTEEESAVVAAAAAAPGAAVSGAGISGVAAPGTAVSGVAPSGATGAVPDPVPPTDAPIVASGLSDTPPESSLPGPEAAGSGDEPDQFVEDEETGSGSEPAGPAVAPVGRDERPGGDVVGWKEPAPRRRGRTAFVAATVVVIAAGVFTLRILKPSLFGWPDPTGSTPVSTFTESEMGVSNGESSLLDVVVEPGIAAEEADSDGGSVPVAPGAETAEEASIDEAGIDARDAVGGEPDDAGAMVAELPSGEGNGDEQPLGSGGGTIVGPGGPYEVVVKSVTTEEGGWAEAADLLDAGFGVGVVRVDLGDKGVWYRVVLDGGFPSLDDARVMTAVLDEAGFGGSWVTRN
jgi:type II secretory pathway predicted ATPase ExeA